MIHFEKASHQQEQTLSTQKSRNSILLIKVVPPTSQPETPPVQDSQKSSLASTISRGQRIFIFTFIFFIGNCKEIILIKKGTNIKCLRRNKRGLRYRSMIPDQQTNYKIQANKGTTLSAPCFAKETTILLVAWPQD